MSGKEFLYIAASPTYSSDYQIKVGISDDPHRRVTAFKRYDHLFKLVAVFSFENRNFPEVLECDMIAHFYKKAFMAAADHDENHNLILKRRGREFFEGDPRHFIAYAKRKAKASGETFRRVL